MKKKSTKSNTNYKKLKKKVTQYLEIFVQIQKLKMINQIKNILHQTKNCILNYKDFTPNTKKLHDTFKILHQIIKILHQTCFFSLDQKNFTPN